MFCLRHLILIFTLELLQLTGVLNYKPVNAFDLGNELGYSVTTERGKKDCSTASKVLSLKRAGYIVSLQTCRSNIIFPLVRSFADKKGGKAENYNPMDGFQKFLSEEERIECFRSLNYELSYTDHYNRDKFVIRRFSKDAELSLKDPYKWKIDDSPDKITEKKIFYVIKLIQETNIICLTN